MKKPPETPKFVMRHVQMRRMDAFTSQIRDFTLKVFIAYIKQEFGPQVFPTLVTALSQVRDDSNKVKRVTCGVTFSLAKSSSVLSALLSLLSVIGLGVVRLFFSGR